ncbi:unnamed protein product, partial [Choristocarpus tenellus]
GHIVIDLTIVVLDGVKLSICGSGDSTSVVDGGNVHQLFSVSGSELHLFDLTLSNGNSTGSGGAIYASDSSMTVESCSFEQNMRRDNGGAISSASTNITFKGESSWRNNH